MSQKVGSAKVHDNVKVTKFEGVQITIPSERSYFEVVKRVESTFQRFSIAKLMEYLTHHDRKGLEAYVDSVSKPHPFTIFWSFEQGSTFRIADIPIESKFYLIGNAVVARGLFAYTAAAGLGAPVRFCVSQRDGEKTRIDIESPTGFFSRFPEMEGSPVPAQLDKMVEILEDVA